MNTSWLQVFLATLFSQQQCNPFSQGELGTCLCRQLSTFFFADLKGGRCQWDACQERDWSGTWLVILACAIARTCQRAKMPGVEKSRGCTLRTLCLDNLGTCRKLTEFQGQLHTLFVDPWRSQSLDVFICTVFDILPVLQLNHPPCNYPSCSTDPDICVGRQWHDTRTPVKNTRDIARINSVKK